MQLKLQNFIFYIWKKINFLKFKKREIKNFWEDSSVPHGPPQFNISDPHKDHAFSAPKVPQFNTKNLSVHHQNPLSSKPPIFSYFLSERCEEVRDFFVWNWGSEELKGFWFEQRGFWCWTERCVELRGFLCETEKLFGLKKNGPFV